MGTHPAMTIEGRPCAVQPLAPARPHFHRSAHAACPGRDAAATKGAKSWLRQNFSPDMHGDNPGDDKPDCDERSRAAPRGLVAGCCSPHGGSADLQSEADGPDD